MTNPKHGEMLTSSQRARDCFVAFMDWTAKEQPLVLEKGEALQRFISEAISDAEQSARQEGWKAGMEEAAVLMETHVCDLTATRESYGVLPMVPLNWKTPGMQSRAAFIRSKINERIHTETV